MAENEMKAMCGLPVEVRSTARLGALVPKRDDARAAFELDSWKVQVFGERCGRGWEISVVRDNNKHGQRFWGWFGEEKLLVSHNVGPCDWPICGFVWDQQLTIANELCRRLNAGEDLSA